jgi:hypothetical protein
VTVTGHDVSLFLHITAVVIGLGSTFAEGLTFPVAMRLDPGTCRTSIACS